MPSKLTLSSKSFYSEDFNISFDFSAKGGIKGCITHFPQTLKLTSFFNGLYTLDGSKIKVSFIIEWQNPNIVSEVLTCFSGIIFNYEFEKECLILRWLRIDQPNTGLEAFMERDLGVLFNTAQESLRLDLKVILKQMPLDIFI